MKYIEKDIGQGSRAPKEFAGREPWAKSSHILGVRYPFNNNIFQP